MIRKLLGKTLGQVVAAPMTVAAEAVEAVDAAVNETSKAITKAVDRIEGRP